MSREISATDASILTLIMESRDISEDSFNRAITQADSSETKEVAKIVWLNCDHWDSLASEYSMESVEFAMKLILHEIKRRRLPPHEWQKIEKDRWVLKTR